MLAKTKISKSGIFKNSRRASMAIIIVGFMLIVVVAGIFLADYLERGNRDTFPVRFYYVDKSVSELKAETKRIKTGAGTEILDNVMRELLSSPQSKNLSQSIPDAVASPIFLNLAHKSDGTTVLEIYMSDEYENLSLTDELFCRASLVWTFTGLDFVDDVAIYSDDKPILRPNGKEYGYLSRENVKISSDFKLSDMESVSVRLYFADAEGLSLVPERRPIMITPGSPIENYIMQALIDGPERDGFYSALPPGTKLENINTDSGTCYVSLSQDFLTNLEGSAVNEFLAVYSIVNSLTELDNIRRVQILVGGSTVPELRSGLDISSPFERYEDIIWDAVENEFRMNLRRLRELEE